MADPEADAARLDRLLAAPDPALLAALTAEDQERRDRQRTRRATRLLVSASALVMAISAIAAIAIAFWSWARASAVTSNPGRAQWLASHGNELFEEARYPEAAASFKLATDFDPTSAPAWSGLGWSHDRNGQPAAASVAFERGLMLDGEHPGVHRGLGNLAFSAGDFARAAAHWRFVRHDRFLAAALLLSGAYREADRVLEGLLARIPDDSLLAAMALAASAQTLDDELAWILTHRDLHGTGDLQRARAWSRYYRQLNAAAAAAFAALLARDPDDADANIGLGFSLVELGQTEAARQRFTARLIDSPGHPAALNGLALCARVEGHLDSAIAGWEHLQQQAPGARSPGRQLPFAYLERGDHDKALPGLLRLAAHHPNDRRVLEGLQRALSVVVR